MKRVCNSQSGMSLLEVTFAAGILATALSLLFGSLISISLLSQLNEDRALANTELSSVLEEIRALDYESLMTYAPETPSHPGVQRAVTITCFDADGAAIELPLPEDANGNVTIPALPNPLEVQVTLLWSNNKGHVFEAKATTSVGR